MVSAWKCDRETCGHVWIAMSEEPPKACARCKCTGWNKEGSAALPSKPAALGEQPKVAEKELPKVAKVDKQPKVVRPKEVVRELPEIPDDILPTQFEEPMCTYVEYDQESGDSFACSLAKGHKGNHKKGRRL